MRSDGEVLPDLRETVVLHELGLVRSDELPGLAARWLATDLLDTESVRMLAGHNAHDPWGFGDLLAASVTEAAIDATADHAQRQLIAVDWVTSKWRLDLDTRNAIRTLARLGETDSDFSLGLGMFVGLNDEWDGGWGRLGPDIKAEAELELSYFLHGED